ncbi:MAG TPA: RNA polymerase sigma factor [Kofleriaceae bacterium]|nr:RNA polymerase sigma factor [Kofleriaceae bacterium]
MEDEAAIRAAHATGDMEETVRLGLAHYQVEVYSFLCARLRSEADAHDVFAQLLEDIWRGIASFAWRSSFRTWLYTLARNAAVRFERTPANQARRHARASEVAEPAAVERSRTRPYLRTDVKDRFAALRSTITPDEQSILVLRVDRGLRWDEVARILHDGDEPDEATVAREASNLRQRFRQLKERLREMARAEGLLDDER